MAEADGRLNGRTGEGWHPEPELLDIRDEGLSRTALERLGEQAWTAALDYVYEHGMARAIGEPGDYEELRAIFFGPSGAAGPAPGAAGSSRPAVALLSRSALRPPRIQTRK